MNGYQLRRFGKRKSPGRTTKSVFKNIFVQGLSTGTVKVQSKHLFPVNTDLVGSSKSQFHWPINDWESVGQIACVRSVHSQIIRCRTVRMDTLRRRSFPADCSESEDSSFLNYWTRVSLDGQTVRRCVSRLQFVGVE